MTKQEPGQAKKTLSADWLVQGVLTKLGDTFDRITGRSWNPSSNLATSKLIEKLKVLLDSEIKDFGKAGRFVPHIITLKMQWDKFSTDSEKDLIKLEHELHAAAIDHINDRRYHTHAPLEIEIKTDYFTEGVRLLGGFGKFAEDEEEDAAIDVTLPNLKSIDSASDGKISVVLNAEEIARNQCIFLAKFVVNGKSREVELDFTQEKRITVGRAKDGFLVIDDSSVSKIHASLVIDSEKQLLVADTGSTNGTFVSGNRIPYGKAVAVGSASSVKFGSIDVVFERREELPQTGEVNEPGEGVEPPMTESAIGISGGAADSGMTPTEVFDHESANEMKPLEDESVEDADSDKSPESGPLPDAALDKTQDWEL